MTTYHLRNGLTIDAEILRPTLSEGTQPVLDFEEKRPLEGNLRFSTASFTSDGVPVVPCIRVNATVKARNFSANAIKDNAVRFVQICTISQEQFDYFGATRTDGAVTWFFRGDLVRPTIDSRTEKVKVPFSDEVVTIAKEAPYASPDDQDSLSRDATGYFVSLQDTPSISASLLDKNKQVSFKNSDGKSEFATVYLARVVQVMSFETVLVFVHKDKTREPLQSWGWTCDRDVQLRWVNGKPQIVGTAKSDVRIQALSKDVFGLATDIERLASTGRIMNIVAQDAITTARFNKDVSFIEVKSGIPAPAGFWAFDAKVK